ncbi:hypothetical protein VTG60DRAFT_4295 [Thermothelomyces hinnuleus]
MMAAAYAKDLLHQIPVNKIIEKKRISEVLGSIRDDLETFASDGEKRPEIWSWLLKSRHGFPLLTHPKTSTERGRSGTRGPGNGSSIARPSMSGSKDHVAISGFKA